MSAGSMTDQLTPVRELEKDLRTAGGGELDKGASRPRFKFFVCERNRGGIFGGRKPGRWF